jgi:hypothetical protein
MPKKAGTTDSPTLPATNKKDPKVPTKTTSKATSSRKRKATEPEYVETKEDEEETTSEISAYKCPVNDYMNLQKIRLGGGVRR